MFLALPATAAARTTRIDCRAPGALERASAVVLGPADRLLLRRGTVCSGALKLQGGGGAPGRRAVLGAYGRGARPRIDGDGTEALLLRDVDHVIVRDLELTNSGPEAPRSGIRVVAAERALRDITVRRLYVHDVDGDLAKGRAGSSGIQAETVGEPPVRFERLRILGNRVERVSRSGISLVGTRDATRPDADTPWPEASTGVRIARNRVDRVGGDGIVPRGTVRALVTGNVVSRGNLRGKALFDPTGAVCNAGIWTFHANRTIIQRNEVFGFESHDCDGTGFDIDYDQDGTVVQFNYSHGNEGGFILLCSDTNPHHRADVRFNLTVDDASTLNTVPCPVSSGGGVGDLSGIRVYNNTIVAPRPNLVAEQFDLPLLVGGGSFVFANNVVVATESSPDPLPCGEDCSHNLFSGLPPSGTDAVTADPRFTAPDRRGRGRLAVGRGFRVLPGSPALGAGRELPGSGARDYFGAGLASPPAIGFSAREGF